MDIGHLVQQAVAPVFLLSGVGVTLGVLTTRLARIVDRARYLEDKLENRFGRPDSLNEQLSVLAKRARYINTAITLSTCSALCVALVVVLLFANAFFTTGMAAAIAILFVAAMFCLTGAFLAFLIEVRIAMDALRIGLPM